MNIDKLEEIARAATPGSWWHDTSHGQIGDVQCMLADGSYTVAQTMQMRRNDVHQRNANADHIAAFDPPTALALLAVVRAAKDHLDAYFAEDITGEGMARNRLVAALKALEEPKP